MQSAVFFCETRILCCRISAFRLMWRGRALTLRGRLSLERSRPAKRVTVRPLLDCRDPDGIRFALGSRCLQDRAGAQISQR